MHCKGGSDAGSTRYRKVSAVQTCNLLAEIESDAGAVLFGILPEKQQRVAIARAVVASPKLILADEPTGNLDSKNSKEVMALLSELNSEGTTIVMVTHSHHDAGYAKRTINLFDGQVVNEIVD